MFNWKSWSWQQLKENIFNWRSWSWKHLFVVLLVLHLLPLWIFAYFPSQDGASHVYNGLVLKEYAKHENYKMRDAWQLNITIFPNWLSHIMLMVLLYVFPPVIAEKVFLSIAIGMVPIAFFYFLNAVHKGREGKFVYAWLGFPFAYNYLLYMGFYNFQLSISFFFFSFGFWWKHKDDMQAKHLVVLYILLLLTYLSHIASYGLIVLGVSIAGGCIWGGRALAAAWRERGAEWFREFIMRLKPLLHFFLYMIPIYFVLMEYYLQSLKQHQEGSHRGMKWIWEYFLGVKSIVYFTDWHIPVNYFLLIILGIGIVISIYYRARRKEWVKQTDVFLLIAIVFTYMFVRAPWGYGPGGWINDRIHLYILLMLAPWLVLDMGKIARGVIAAYLIVFSLLHFGRTAYDHGRIAPEIAELVSGAHLIEPHTSFRHRSPDWHKSDALGRVAYVTPFVHSVAFYGVYANDVAHLLNYEANYNYFPVNRNNYESVELNYISDDYMVAWFYPASEKFADLTPNYDLIHETKNLKLFKRKRAAAPMLEHWDQTESGNLIIRFDMQPDNGETAPNHHPIGPRTMYESGKFGWDTEWNHKDSRADARRISPRQVYQGPKGPGPLGRDAVWGIEDAAFKLDLPNGTYRITNVFQSAESATHEVNLLANGKPIVKKLTVPPGNEKIEAIDTVEVTNGYLIQVIFTPKLRIRTTDKHNHWIWNGFTVEQIF